MSGAIATSAVAAGRVLQRSAVRCSRPQFLRLRAQNPARSFSLSSRVLEKKYTEDHEWVDFTPGDKIATIGISEYAAKALGDVVFVELPSIDLEVTKGESIGAVESVKSASDILTPISGTVTEINNVLEDKPAAINNSPEADGWFAKITINDPAELEELMDEGAYKKFTEEASE
ncbi:hypothetical protein R9X50_00482600 [Acrodontium crateriforme]|uniref:Glycine cleavage system H protein n=1 Tax=Acrodontium crateriforme TaxID=150365 RepID=A0AAQ3M6U1_9PEZI|nr:hypothetical protein R9X50_00482600 [Acrodontium crateriforme]